MLRLVVIALMMAAAAGAADARHRHHRYGYDRDISDPAAAASIGSDRGSERYRSRWRGRYARAGTGALIALLPRDWRLTPGEDASKGQRYQSPSGDAWVTFYGSPQKDGDDQHWKEVAFADGEELTFLQRQPGGLTVAGTKGDKAFYRRAILACGQRQWRQVAFEVPATARRNFEQLINNVSRGLDMTAEADCGEGFARDKAEQGTPGQEKVGEEKAGQE